jgi:uncharacterized protein (TIGR02246 family)
MRIQRCMQRVALAFLAATAAMATRAQTPTGGPWPAGMSNADQTAIQKIVTAQARAWNAADAVGFAADFLPQVVQTNVAGGVTLGQERVRAETALILDSIFKGSTLQATIERVVQLDDAVIVVNVLEAIRDYRKLPPGSQAVDGTLYTRLEEVLVRSRGRWGVASLHNVSVSPAFAPGPAAQGH